MDKEALIKYSPIAVVVIALLLQWNMFARPIDVEVMHRVILDEVAEKYLTKEQAIDFKTQLGDMQKKIDKIYDKIITTK